MTDATSMLDAFVEQTFHRVGLEQLPTHLERHYGVRVARVSELDVGVFRVDRHDGPSWVARVFPGVRSIDGVRGDAAILRALEAAGFPAERCAHAEPVSVHDGQGVLVTEWVEGTKPSSPGRTYAILGGLLGGLHARPAATARAGGAWHHLSATGGPREEVAAARSLVIAAQARAAANHAGDFEPVLAALDDVDDCADLPHGLVHPDFVPANAISTPDDGLVIVDWSGSGRAPRLWSLGWLLWAAGARDLRLVDAAMSRYRNHVTLAPEELERLAAAISARPFLLDCWSLAVGRKTVTDVVQEFAGRRELANAVADRAVAAAGAR